MGLSNYIDARWFFGAFTVGIILVYLTAPAHHLVYQFPNPNNLNTVYSNSDGSCHRYDAQRVNCSDFQGAVKSQPTVADELLRST